MNIIYIFVAISFIGYSNTYIIKEPGHFETQKEPLENFSVQEDLKLDINTEKPAETPLNGIDTTLNENKKTDNETVTKEDNERSCLTIFFSQVAQIFRQLFYGDTKSNNIELVEMEFGTAVDDGNSKEIASHQDTLVNRFNISDPNAEVEIFEPRYHGRLTADKEEVICREGYVMTPKGCAMKNSKMIISVPNQCPLGYRQDWLGFCRKIMYLGGKLVPDRY